MVWPVPQQYKISTGYGIRGPLWKKYGWHTGVDFQAPRGTPVYAAIKGQIRHRDYGSSFGPFQFAISPDKGQPFGDGEVFYAHTLSRLPDGVWVEPGQKIAEVGDLGNATGPHLHFELHSRKNTWDDSVIIDPAPALVYEHTGSQPVASGWLFGAGQKVYDKYLKFNGHEQNPDRISDSIKALQEMLRRHGYDIPITGKYWIETDNAVRDCQAKHVPPADAEQQSFVGPKQWAHLVSVTGCKYILVQQLPAPVTPTAPTAPTPSTPTSAGAPAAPQLVKGAVWQPVKKSGGGWFTGLRPFTGNARKITLHTTETPVVPNWEAQQSGIPHLTVDLRTGLRLQHLPLDIAAYTMQGGAQSPNSDSGLNIQVESIGKTAQIPGWSDKEYQNLHALITDIIALTGVPFDFPLDFKKPTRLDWIVWNGTSGVLGHCHAPYNDHSDPTGLDVARIAPTPPTPPVEPPKSDRARIAASLRSLADEVERLI